MTSLLPIAACVLILTQGLIRQVTGMGCPPQSYQLDMADNAFDDQYEGCTEEMEKTAPQLLKEELEVNKNLKHEWEEAKGKWQKIKNRSYPKQFNDFHGIAIVAYTGNIYKEFNKAVREFHQNSENFHFKAFHYYLTRGLQLLKTGQCYKVYRGVCTKFSYSGSGNVRFGQFSSSSFSKKEAEKFINGTGTMFYITTCLGVDIQLLSQILEEKEVLIPGYEVYQKVTVQSSNKKYNEILLDNPTKFKSKVNCFYLCNNSRIQDYKNTRIQGCNFNSSGMTESPAFLLLLPGLLILLFLPAEL